MISPMAVRAAVAPIKMRTTREVSRVLARSPGRTTRRCRVTSATLLATVASLPVVRRFREPSSGHGETLATLAVVLEHVLARTRGRKDHRPVVRSELERELRGLLDRPGLAHGNCLLEERRDLRRCFPDHHDARERESRLRERREVDSFRQASGDQDGAIDTFERRQRGMGVRRLGVVDETDRPDLSDYLASMGKG